MDKLRLNRLIKKVLKGKKRHFEKILEFYGKRLYGYIHSITGNPNHVDDIYQETILKLYKNLSKYDDNKNFEAWIITMARNTVYDHARKKSKVIYIEDLNEPLVKENIESELINKERLSEIDICISSLKEEQQEMIYLKYFSGLSYDEIANHMGVEIKRVKWQLYEARKSLLSNDDMRRLHDEM